MAKKVKAAGPRRENPIKRAAEQVEERFFEGAELATATTSPETNIVLAAEAAIVGKREAKAKGKGPASNASAKKVRPKKR